MHVVLVHPEIPPNTGNIIRLCANTGASLHLIEPLGFSLEDRLLRRAGLDYHDLANVTIHASFDAAVAALPGRWLAFSSSASYRYTDVAYQDDDVLVFGRESVGLSPEHMARFDTDHQIKIPIQPDNRSLNLSNSVSVAMYEAWRQLGFPGAVK